MIFETSDETGARLTSEASNRGISVCELVERLLNELGTRIEASDPVSTGLPVWHLGDVGSLHRRDIYDDVR